MTELDGIIYNRYNHVINECSLDEVNNDDEILNSIYLHIYEEAGLLKDNGDYNYKIKKRKVSFKNRLLSLHRKLKNKKWYNKIMSPKVKSLIKRSFNHEANINLCKLMKKNNEDFVRELYVCMFSREADKEGFDANLKMLEDKKIKRMDMVYAFYNSDERTLPRYLKWRRLAKILYGDK